jgi:hypothetical protein
VTDKIHPDSRTPSPEQRGGEQPETSAHGGPSSAEWRQNHDTMRSAAMHRIAGPASTDDLAAGGGLNVPGGEAHPELAAHAPSSNHGGDAPGAPAPSEPIPGERDPSTMMHRQPGAIGGQFAGAGVPSPDTHGWMDDRTAREHAREGGGGAVRKSKDSSHR